MKKLNIGILAHVDAGKTTLSEALLYISGSIRKMGRVDNQDAFLDTDVMEKERGITIFSKQAEFTYRDMAVTLLDTPGHVDFSAEMERTLQVLDYAILLINGADGIQAHTRTLWRLLARYGVPVFIFVNKMDQQGADKDSLLSELQESLNGACIDFENTEGETFLENVAVCDEALLETFLEQGRIEDEQIRRLIRERKIFPVFFGSALRIEGVEELLQGILRFAKEPSYPKEFGARVFKITRDMQGNRLTYLKVTGGCLRVRDTLRGRSADAEAQDWEEKVTGLRVYSGEKFGALNEAPAGTVCAVTGLSHTFPGEGLGEEEEQELPLLEPVLVYRVILPPEEDAAAMLPKLKLLEEEEPQLHVVWDETLKEIQVRIMGEIQLEILQRQIKDRFGIVVEFGEGSVVYKETIAEPAVGVGHFEPLRHYAEVQLLLEPGEAGSGLTFASVCSEDVLARNWQRLILTHLEEKEHRGVLTGAPVTDMKITLLTGRAHLKHTEGGDFRQATYRAVRQGLMEAPCILLEPYYAFTLEVPEKFTGRAMTDIDRMQGTPGMPRIEGGTAVLTGIAPVVTIRGYQKEVTAYTQGLGRLFCTLKGYFPCHNTEEVMERMAYDPEADLRNPTGSVFCAHGAGFVVPWDEVREYMHTEAVDAWWYGTENGEGAGADQAMRYTAEDGRKAPGATAPKSREVGPAVISTEEIDSILERAFGANKRNEDAPRKGIYKRPRKEKITSVTKSYKPVEKKTEYLLVDGYNIIFAWEELADLAKVSIDGARGRLLDILCDYQGMRDGELIVVFDAYRVQGHQTEISDYHNIHVVFTKEAETADQYIEKFAHENAKKYRVTVATSDGLEQIIIRGEGCALLSARDLLFEIERVKKQLREEYHI
ncbi:MAG: TetM/TetW/TetO/TetS family tetracycline resistance ribosomal protection protein [Lachnospiraceae bacterium]|nr:TetM/TetW/TetO/TetS family tetracycline resistance ribosomal protection protein [Lachnospiraceae bacterium]